MPTHGTASAYRNGCRCDDCRAAHTERAIRERRSLAERLAADPTLAPHGTWSTYNNWGCRCDLCMQAKADKWSKYSPRRRELRRVRSADSREEAGDR